MTTDYEFIHFSKVADSGKTSAWDCLTKSSNQRLGSVKWYPRWRKYAFFPTENTVFSTGCISDLLDFIDELTILRIKRLNARQAKAKEG